MKLSKILHVLSVIAGVVGIVMIFNSGNMMIDYSMMGKTAVASGNMMARSPITYFLIAIWLQVATIHHMKLEEKGESI